MGPMRRPRRSEESGDTVSSRNANIQRMKTTSLVCAVIASGLSVVGAHTANAARIFGLTTSNEIKVFDSGSPMSITSSGAVTGLNAGDTLVALDYQPASGNVLLLGSQGSIYKLNSLSGFSFAATLLNVLDPIVPGADFAFDFNPAFMAGAFARIISNENDNRVINGSTGQYLAPVEKTDVFYAAGDANEGADPNIVGIAYDNNVPGAVSTQQYGIDATLGVLTTVANNAGTLATVGSLGIGGPLSSELGFDIAASGEAFASINSDLYRIDLASGAASVIGSIGGAATIRDITAVPQPVPDSATSAGLLGCALLGLAIARRRTRAA